MCGAAEEMPLAGDLHVAEPRGRHVREVQGWFLPGRLAHGVMLARAHVVSVLLHLATTMGNRFFVSWTFSCAERHIGEMPSGR